MANNRIVGRIHSIETLGTVDGPGMRFIIFVQGCVLRCQYCHNPDTWKLSDGQERTAQDLFDEAIKYKNYWDVSGGGVTVSGGEPLIQIDFLIELFKLFKAAGVHTTIDSSGGIFDKDNTEFMTKMDQLIELTDLILLDIKHIDPEKHLGLTKRSNQPVLNFAEYLKEKNQPIWIRHVLVPGKSDEPKDLRKLRKFLDTLPNVKKIEILPYHKMGTYKWQQLGMPYALEGTEPPSAESVALANQILNN